MALGLDFGGTKLLAGLVETDTGRVLARSRKPTPVSKGAEGCIDVMIECAMSVLATSGTDFTHLIGVGISFGGPVKDDRREVLRSMHVPGWDNLPLPDRVASVLGVRAVMDNDANAAALGESKFGAGRDVHDFVYLQVSTGIGCGVIANGTLVRGRGQAGEIGHLKVVPGGQACSCGGRGCLESVASGWALAQRGREELARASPSSPLRVLYGDSRGIIDAQLIFLASRKGDDRAKRIVHTALEGLASAIAAAICIVDPQLIVIGGGMGKGIEEYAEDLSKEIYLRLPATLAHRASLSFSQLGEEAALVGAASLLEEG